MKILVINSGSSSIKYKLFDMSNDVLLTDGLVERIGGHSTLRHSSVNVRGTMDEQTLEQPLDDHRAAFALIRQVFLQDKNGPDTPDIGAIGHRIVHGGERFNRPVLVDEVLLREIEGVNNLAPLHNPANLAGIEVCREIFSGIDQVAIFDTAFHQTMPETAFRYPVPDEWYTEYAVRRYGFHGTSHANVARQAAEYLNIRPQGLNLITIHLGNGASMAAVRGGICVDTTMGLTPLEGLMMGTRCGDIDPSIPFYIERKTGADLSLIENRLNRFSGLKGICGANDMREVIRRSRQGDADARLAIDMYCYRIKKYIGAYSAVLNNVDALIFTAGIGENSAPIRKRVCSNLDGIGIRINEERNNTTVDNVLEIQEKDSKVKVLVIRTREEWEIARQTLACVENKNS